MSSIFKSTASGTLSATINLTLSFNMTTIPETNNSNAIPNYNFAILFPALFCCSVVFLIGVPGNAMVIYVIGMKNKANRSNDGSAFIVSLAVADLLASLFVPLVIAYDFLSPGKWYLGQAMCHLLPTLNPINLIASSWTLVLISVERYRIISRPFSSQLTTKAKGILITSVWLFGILINTPVLAALRHKEKSCYTKKLLSPELHLAYFAFYTLVGWLIPAAIMVVTYYQISRQLRHSEAYHSDTQVMQRQIRSENKRVVRMFIIIVALYFLFTLPFAVYQVVFSIFWHYDTARVKRMEFLTPYLLLPCISAMNSCVNPLVYAKMHREINRYLHGIRCQVKCCCCSANNQTMLSQRGSRDVSRQCSTQCETSFTVNLGSVKGATGNNKTESKQ